jgi:hypothetical protein
MVRMPEGSRHGPPSRNPVRIVAVVCFLVIQGFCFKDILFLGAQFGYQDAADFYYPLYQRVQQEWSAGRFPLWEPEENGGMPLLGNPTSAVLYPGKLIYAVLPYPWAARIYPLAHILLAAFGTYALARFSSVSPTGASVAMLGYACGAPLVHSTSNVIFLVGAAWTPFAWLAIDGWIRLERLRYLLGLGMILGLQILGGDPQAAYLELVAAIVYIFVRSGRSIGVSLSRTSGAILLGGGLLLGSYVRLLGQTLLWGSLGAILAARLIKRRRTDILSRQLIGLTAALILALLLAGIQIVPSLEFISQSSRTVQGWGHEVYRFSMSPFELLGSFFPGWTGTIKGRNTIWLRMVPPAFEATEFWFPSLYLGVPTLILGLGAASLRRGTRWHRFLTIVLLIYIIGGLGTHGSPLPWARWLLGPESPLGPVDGAEGRSDGLPGDGFLSPYWVMTLLLPGFHTFRYPAKLLLPASLALACLAGHGWDLLGTPRRRRIIRTAAVLTCSSMVLLGPILAGQSGILATFSRLAELGRSAFGPFDVVGTLGGIRSAVMHGTVASVAVLFALTSVFRCKSICISYLIILISIDLILANRDSIIAVPQEVFDSNPKVLKIIEEAERSNPSKGPFRVHRMSWSPSQWSMEPSKNRPEEIVRWDRDALRVKYGIPLGVAYTQAMGTAELLDHTLFFGFKRFRLDDELTRKFGLKPGQEAVYYTRRGFDLWSTRYFVLPNRLAVNSRHRGFLSFLPDTTELYPGGSSASPEMASNRRHLLISEDVQVLRNEVAFPRAWIVHETKCLPEMQGTQVADRARITDDIVYQDDELWHVENKPVTDVRRVAWIETDHPQEIKSIVKRADSSAPESVVVKQYEAQRVALEAKLVSPGIVVLADVFYPGWVLRVDGEVRPIYRTNRAMRGALVEAGTHTLIYEYKPQSVWLGAGLSTVGLLILIAGSTGSHFVFVKESRHQFAHGPKA